MAEMQTVNHLHQTGEDLLHNYFTYCDFWPENLADLLI